MAGTIEHRGFSLAPDEWAHIDFTRRLHQRLEALGGGKVCELGGGARPALELEFLQRNGLECLVVDIAAPELDKAPDGYATLVGDVSSSSFSTGEHDGQYDVVFSRVLAEHVTDARQFHTNVHRLLRPGGIAMHFFPTLWWPPFVVNRVLPESAAEWILLKVEPWRVKSGKSGKSRRSITGVMDRLPVRSGVWPRQASQSNIVWRTSASPLMLPVGCSRKLTVHGPS
jgi:SAM-dependent methyltransferase